MTLDRLNRRVKNWLREYEGYRKIDQITLGLLVESVLMEEEYKPERWAEVKEAEAKLERTKGRIEAFRMVLGTPEDLL